jgi:WD40 repeat protein
MKVSNSEHEYFFSNDIGEIYKCDSRKDWKTLGKYKGITSTVTDFQISNACNVLAATSLDSYVRLYELDTCKLIKKIYINKPAYCI